MSVPSLPHHFDHVTAGQTGSRELGAITYCYLVVKGELKAGLLFTAEMTNLAIDWWNSLSDGERYSFEATLAMTYVYPGWQRS